MDDIRILVVDDEAAERITLGEVLRLEGYHVTLAASGEQALAIVRQEPMFDLAILDLRLPGMDGLQVLDGIRRISAETIVILITGYGTLETAVQALRKGAYDFLLKPSPVEEVLVAVRRGRASPPLADQPTSEYIASSGGDDGWSDGYRGSVRNGQR